MSNQKRCCRCKEYKDISEFYSYSPRCKKCEVARARQTYQKYKERYRKKAMEAYWANHSQRIMRMREYAHKLRVDAFNRYGGPKCACCGETSWAFLSLDHINGGGCKHRREMKGGGLFTYRWLKKHGYPEGYQVLCMNCNFGKAQNGGICPHEENKIKTKNP